MGKCVNHPEVETQFLCMKHEVYLCQACLECRDPEIYCKFRSACPIWFVYKEIKRQARHQAEAMAAQKCREVYKPDHKEVLVAGETNLLEAARQADALLNASCNGK